MSQSHELQLHINKLAEIRSILNSMKNLALIETHKLVRLNSMQSQAVAAIGQVAEDFLHFHPSLKGIGQLAKPVCILIGSERGFCGDYNEKLLQAIKPEMYARIIATGIRLTNKLADGAYGHITLLAGANSTEEVPDIVHNLVTGLELETNTPDNRSPHLHLTAVYHENTSGQLSIRRLLPFYPKNTSAQHPHYPPQLNLTPEVFFSDLLSQYLYSVLHEILYLSLAAENHHRLQHLESAVNHLDGEIANLQRKSQIYRQEEITEEIEVILLNAENV